MIAGKLTNGRERSAHCQRRVHRLRTLLLASVAVSLAAFTAACDRGGSGGGDTNAVRVITSARHSLNFIGVEGNLNQWGSKLSVKLISGNSGTVTATLAGGTADIGLQAGNTAGLAIAKGLKAKIIGAMILPWNQYLIASTKSGATEPAQLKGKKFGITSFGSGGDYSTEMMASKLGWSKSDYKVVKISGGASGLMAALKSGTIDAFYWSSDIAYRSEADGYGKVIASAVDYVGPTAFEVFIAADDFIQKHSSKIKDFMNGYVNAIKQIKADPSKAVNIMTKWGTNAEVAKRSVQSALPQLDEDGLIPKENLEGLGNAVSFLTHNSTKNQDPSSWYQPWNQIH